MNTVKSAGESNIFSDWINGGYADWNQKQLLSLIVVVLICLIFSLYVFIKIKKYAKEDKAPKVVLFWQWKDMWITLIMFMMIILIEKFLKQDFMFLV